MKKILYVFASVFAVMTILSMINTPAEAVFDYFDTKDQAHQIADMARSMGLPEEDPIIARAKELWNAADAAYNMDIEILTTVIYNESGYGCTDEHMSLVGMVVINRVYYYQTSIYDVVVAPGQYLPAYATPGSKYWLKAREDQECYNKCRAIAKQVLDGEIDCPQAVLFQANFTQGTVYKQFWACGNWTYFCYAD